MGKEASKEKQKPLRADALRNRQRILDAAAEIFLSKGKDASTEDIAKLAKVGIGTVFRHFPTKQSLLEDLIRTRLSDLAEEANSLVTDKESALFLFLSRLVEQSASKRKVIEALACAGGNVSELLDIAGQDLRDAFGRLLRRAQKAGMVREDIEPRDVLSLLLVLAHTAEQGGWSEETRQKMLSVLFQGIQREKPTTKDETNVG